MTALRRVELLLRLSVSLHLILVISRSLIGHSTLRILPPHTPRPSLRPHRRTARPYSPRGLLCRLCRIRARDRVLAETTTRDAQREARVCQSLPLQPAIIRHSIITI